ncbi:MAG: alkaline shock response membrane anchor protein AmaP [Clostridia bacterium]|nr:alkaline shock response membrane anchor protein AmaP [Clostridia bacterium]
MKLNFGKKLVLVLHWLLSLIACAMAVFFCVWPETIAKGFDFLYSLIGKGSADIVGAVVLAIYALLSVITAVMLFSSKNRRAERGFITVDSSDAGRTRIAIGAVDQMIRQAVRGVEGIADMKSGIVNNTDAISINCSVTIANGAHVPTVTMNIQRAIRSYIELNCGVAVREVSVSVHALDDGSGKGRKKGKNTAQAAAPSAPVYAPEPVQEAVKEIESVAEPVIELVAEEEPAPAVEEEETAELPEIEPITLTLDPPAEADEAPAEEIQAEE